MNEITYEGPFKEHLCNFLALKQAVGYKYFSSALQLKLFDRYTMEHFPYAESLNKEIVLGWCNKKAYEAQANQLNRVSIMRQFGKYLDATGQTAYIIPKGYYQKEKPYVPYIYSIDELNLFFAQTDRCCYCSSCPTRHLIMPVLFRMIYQCGLRVSEARLLKVGDVDLKTGVLTINHSKKDICRLVPMADSLLKRCRDYSSKVHLFSSTENYYFPAPGGKPLTNTNIYHNFRRFLWQAGISHKGRGYGPRIHDFRHVYAVHCLKKWSKEGKDLAVYLPLLKTYMGHYSFQETAYYLRLTADVFPEIILKLESRYPGIIPELGGDYCEAD